ncbi:MAG: pilus assembly protein TadG-related protein [Novosphingobium sp.]
MAPPPLSTDSANCPHVSGRGWLVQFLRDTSGNTLAIIAAAMLPLLAIIGGGIDMGRSYLSETRLQQACDAGVLAARKKLGSTIAVTGTPPSGVAAVGNQLFNLNFRNGSYGTRNRNFAMKLEPNYSISGVATVEVPTTIMAILGFAKVDVRVNCEAQLNFNNTDVMMVLDTTGSMNDTNSGDPMSKIDTLKSVVRSFHAQMEAAKGPGIRIRYGFVPYSFNVNVGGLLDNNWVVNTWTYQSRELDHIDGTIGTHYDWANWTYISGTYSQRISDTYAATYSPPSGETGTGRYNCNRADPNDTYSATYTLVSTTDEPYAGPPAGTKTTKHYRRVANGLDYWTSLSGTTCNVYEATYSNYTDEYDEITYPEVQGTTYWRYAPISRDVSNWRNESNGCIEERDTYEITDYNNVDFTRALDLDLDTVPTAGVPSTQWRPAYPGIIYERKLNWSGSGTFQVAEEVTRSNYFMPSSSPGLGGQCPPAARKLAELPAANSTGYNANLESFLNSLVASGATYHDIGMIWGGRLISPTGLFAAENADQPNSRTQRHLIFLTDGLTQPRDVTYGAYGVEPLDGRRWSQSSSQTLTQVVEGRFSVACEQVKNRNVTVWAIGFGVTVPDLLKTCAGNGRWFQANNASQLNDAFSKIAAAMGDLRISR